MKHHPRVDEAENRRLAAAWRDEARPLAERQAARNALVLGNIGIAIAMGRAARLPGEIPEDDRVAEATLALLKAAEGWDPGRGVPFAGYARAAITFALRALGASDRTIAVPYYLISGVRAAMGRPSYAAYRADARRARSDFVSLSPGAYPWPVDVVQDRRRRA